MANYLIVGASTGIGAALAQQLIKEGNSVYGTYNQHAVENDNGAFASIFKHDVLQADFDLDKLPEILDGVVYCPGSINLKPFHRIKPEDFIADFELQVVGAIKLIQQVLPRLKKSNQGSILLFSTVAVQIGMPFHTQVSTSKGAIEGLTRSLAAELSPSIRVNCIAPSLTDTPLAASLLNTEVKRAAGDQRHPLKRIGTPDDIAEMGKFLLCEKSSWITGQILSVDGGLTSIKLS